MKKTLILSALAVAFATFFTACLDDDDSHTDVECQYGGSLASLSDFEGLEDSVTFAALIGEAFQEIGVTGDESVFTIELTVNVANLNYAYLVADARADSVYQVELAQLTLDKVKSAIFSAHSDSLVDVGISSASDIPLEGFTATFELYSARDTDPVSTTDIEL